MTRWDSFWPDVWLEWWWSYDSSLLSRPRTQSLQRQRSRKSPRARTATIGKTHTQHAFLFCVLIMIYFVEVDIFDREMHKERRIEVKVILYIILTSYVHSLSLPLLFSLLSIFSIKQALHWKQFGKAVFKSVRAQNRMIIAVVGISNDRNWDCFLWPAQELKIGSETSYVNMLLAAGLYIGS